MHFFFWKVFIGDIDPVEKFCDQVMEAYLDDPEEGELLSPFHTLKVLCLLQREEVEKACDLAGLIIESYPENLFVAYAAVLFEMERYSEGMQQVSLVPEYYSGDEPMKSLMKQGLAALCLETAIDDLVRLGGKNLIKQVELVHERATRLKNFRIKKHAVEACTWIIGQKNDDPIIRQYMADSFHMLGDLEDNFQTI